jgi:hypothetical protein
MTRFRLALCVAVLGVVVTATVALAGGRSHFRTDLSGAEEVPFVSTEGTGTFRAVLDPGAQQIRYRLTYSNLNAPVQQAHIHLGQRLVSGGIAVFLCSNLGNGPAGTQTCPDAPGTVTGSFGPADVVGPANQGLVPGEATTFDELVRAMRSGVTYANVHTAQSPAGEIRGQIGDKHDDGGHGDRDDWN